MRFRSWPASSISRQTDRPIHYHHRETFYLALMHLGKQISKAYAKFIGLPPSKRVLYTVIFVLWHAILLVVAIFSNKLQSNLQPLASRMERLTGAWIVLSLLIAVVSIPPLFGHELLAVIAGYVYGIRSGFAILTISSILGETLVYFAFRFWLKHALDAFRSRHRQNYAIFVSVIEEGGLLMLCFVRMSVIPPHFSTPLFSSLDSITWYSWLLANILASPVKFFPSVFVGALLRDKHNNSLIGDLFFILSTVTTLGVLFHIYRKFMSKKHGSADHAQKQDIDKETNAQANDLETIISQTGKVATSDVAPNPADQCKRDGGNETHAIAKACQCGKDLETKSGNAQHEAASHRIRSRSFYEDEDIKVVEMPTCKGG